MKYAITGSGKIGTALARTFERKNIEVAIANSRGPQDAYEAEMIFLAVPFSAHKDVAKQLNDWGGKIVVDLTNAFHIAPGELGGLLSSEVVAQAFVGGRVVKAFNHLPAERLGTNVSVDGQRQVVFVASNDAEASASVAAVVTELGFAEVELGRLDEGGAALHVVGGKPGGLLFQNLVKLAES